MDNITTPTSPTHKPVVSLFMRVAPLSSIPELPALPPGYDYRVARQEESAELASLLQSAFTEMTWTPERVDRELLNAQDVDSVYVITYENNMIATASARIIPEKYPNAGYLHWVGANPAYKGKGFGRAVTLRVLHHFHEAGLSSSVLETDDFRIPAIKSYLALGYHPEYTDSTHSVRWQIILDKLGMDL